MSKRVALVTGVSSGIGLTTAKLLARQGWVVVGTTRDGRPVGDMGGVAVDIQAAEMTDLASLPGLVERTFSTYGRIDALVLNAGYGRLTPFGEITEEEMVDQLIVNTVAPAVLLQAALPFMLKQPSGVIVGLSSIAGRVGFNRFSMYSASKFGLEGLFDSLRYELPSSIRLRLIEPGPVSTRFWQKAQPPRGSVSPTVIAEAIVHSIESRSSKLRYPIGIVRLVMVAKWALPDRLFRRFISLAGRNYVESP